MPVSFRLRQPYEDIVRLRTITEVLLSNGLGFVAEQLGLTSFLPPWRKRSIAAGDEANKLSVPKRVRHTIEQLGPTFIKLGQMLSTRPDLLPPEYIEELSQLLDAAPPVSSEEILAALERELGAPAADVFAHFETAPLASASIGQAHRAVLKSGDRVIVKVRRPGIEPIVEADLDLLARQARFLENRLAIAREYRLRALVDEFSYTLREELDYRNEGRNADRLRHNSARDERVIVPRVYWDWTTREVITLQEVQGVKLTQLELLRSEGYDLPRIAETIVDAYLKQVFVDGFFHADPHPANILVCDGQIGWIDLGMMGQLMPDSKTLMADLLTHTLNQDVEQITQTLLRLGAVGQQADASTLSRDIQRLLHRYYGLALEEMQVADFMGDMMAVAFRHHIRLPADLAMLARGVVVLEGVARSLDPQFVLVDRVRPFVQKLVQERVSLHYLARRTLGTLRDVDQLLQVLPRRVEGLSRQLQEGELTVGIELRHLQVLMARLDRVANRLSFSILVAALIIGSGLILSREGAALVWRVPLLGFGLPIPQIGFIIAGILAAWLLFSIIRAKGL